jgi:hypothetical protein
MNLDRPSVGGVSFPFPCKSRPVPFWSYLQAAWRIAKASVSRKMWVGLSGILLCRLPNPPSFPVYSEYLFHQLLANERKRFERSGHSFKILLVYVITPDGSPGRMENSLAHKLLMGLSQSIRETDYVGWYRDEMIVGGVLTALVQDPTAEVPFQVEQRFAQVLQGMLSIPQSSRTRFRMCDYYELEGIESGVCVSQSIRSI